MRCSLTITAYSDMILSLLLLATLLLMQTRMLLVFLLSALKDGECLVLLTVLQVPAGSSVKLDLQL